MPELCDTPQIRKEENSMGETYTRHTMITLTNITAEFMALKTFLIDELHSVNKKINLIKNSMNNGQILDDQNIRDDNNSKNTIIKVLTENFRHHKIFQQQTVSRETFYFTENINKTAATDKNIAPLASRFRNLIFDYTNDLETGTNKQNENHQNDILVI